MAEARFWRWFESNEKRLFAFEADQEAIFDDFASQLHRVDPHLTFEFGPEHRGRREFVISADGIRSAFAAVESLVATAPALARWTFIKLRPRRSPVMSARFGGAEVSPADVEYELFRDGPKTGINLCFDRAITADESVMKNIGYLLLDEALGEYDVETRVGPIEFEHLTPNAGFALCRS